MSDIDKRLRDAFDKVAVCRCGNGFADGCCDNHNPSWNPCPDSQLLYDARYRIAALEATERELREALKVLAEASMGAEDAKLRMRECQKSIAGACGQTVQECFAAMRYHNVPSSIFDRYDDAMQAAMSNPIAAESVREAAK